MGTVQKSPEFEHYPSEDFDQGDSYSEIPNSC